MLQRCRFPVAWRFASQVVAFGMEMGSRFSVAALGLTFSSDRRQRASATVVMRFSTALYLRSVVAKPVEGRMRV